MRTFHRLRLLILVFTPTLVILQFSTLCPVETKILAHHKCTNGLVFFITLFNLPLFHPTG
jgi:hypothetical protein